MPLETDPQHEPPSSVDLLFRARDRLQRWIVPELRYSQSSYEDCLRQLTSGVNAWLDVGCGHRLLPEWRGEAEADIVRDVPLIVGMDFDLAALRAHRSIAIVLRADVAALPFGDHAFDLVTANMVVEHLARPADQFREISRVLKPGGIFLFHTPNLHSYVIQVARLLPDAVKTMLARLLEGRVAADVFPTFYRANTDAAIRSAAASAGLDVEEIRFTLSSPVFGRVAPLAALELLFLRQLSRRRVLHPFRQTLICVLRRPLLA